MGLKNKRVDDDGNVLCANEGCQNEARERGSYCSNECYEENNETRSLL